MKLSTPSLSGPAQLSVSSLLFAVQATAAGSLRGRVPPAEMVSARFGLGVAALALFFVLRRRGPDLKRWPKLLLRGALGSVAVYTYFFAIDRIGAGPATMLNFVSPCYAAVFAPLFLKEKSSRLVLVGLAVATVGACLVAWGSSKSDALGNVALGPGVLAGVVSGVCGGAATTAVRSLRQSTDSFSIFFVFCVVGLVLTVPLTSTSFVAVGRADYLVLAVLITTSLVAQLIYTHAMAVTPAVVAGVANQLTPVFAFALGVVFLKEVPHGLTLVGSLLCIGGVLLGLYKPREQPAAALVPPATLE